MTCRVTLVAWLILLASRVAAQPLANPEVDDVLARLRVDRSGWTAARVAGAARREAPDVHIAQANADEARSAIGLARAALMPRLTLGAGYSRLSELDLPPFEFGGMSTDNPFPQILNRYALSADLSIPISSLAEGTPGVRAARSASEAAQWTAESAERRIVLATLVIFYQHLRARGAEIVAEDAVRLLSSVVVDLDRLHRAGAATRADLLEARAELASARVQVSTAVAAASATRAQLRAILNVPESDAMMLGEDLLSPLPPAPTVQDIVARGLRTRPEAHALRRTRAAARDEERLRRRQQIPRVFLTGGLLYARPNPRIVPSTDRFDGSWELGIAVSWTPNDLAVARHQISAARARTTRADAGLEQIEDAIHAGAAKAVHDYEAALQAVDAALEGRDAAQEGFRARQRLREVGASTSRQVLDAEVQLRRAQIQLLDAHIRARLARLAIAEAAGDPLPP